MKTYKNYLFIIISFCFLLASCAFPVTYLGDRLTPTSSIDFFYSAHDVKTNYKVIGHLVCNNVRESQVKQSLIEYGKKIGADAIVLLGTSANGDTPAGMVNADALKYIKE